MACGGCAQRRAMLIKAAQRAVVGKPAQAVKPLRVAAATAVRDIKAFVKPTHRKPR